MTEKFKPTGTTGFFGEEFRLEKLSKQGDPLEKLAKFYLIQQLLLF